VAVIWDLDHNTEIKTLEHIYEFGHENHYSRTGFKYFRVHTENKKFKMNETAFLHTNPDTTLISAPLTSTYFSSCFRLHTFLELL
jgi:hypothetical protein